jgi:hypothetical protein
MRDFALSPDEKFIFAACGYGGAWVYSIQDDNWFQMSDDPIPSVDFTAVQFIENKNCVRYSTFGSGVIEFNLNTKINSLKAPSNLKADLLFGKHIELNWSDLSDDEEGYYIERASDADFVRIDTVYANQTNYIDKNTEFTKTYYYRVKAFNSSTVSYKSNMVFFELQPEGYLSKNNWTIVAESSEEGEWNYRAPSENAIDGNVGTIWHTEWYANKPAHPHFIVIDLGQQSVLSGFRYLPRQDDNQNGNIAKYEFYVSDDISDWGNAGAKGEFISGSAWKKVLFEQAETGRYVKLVALSEINGKDYTSVAEIDVLYHIQAPEAPTNLTATLEDNNNVLLEWYASNNYETGYIVEHLKNGEYVIVASVNSSTTSHKLYSSTQQPCQNPDCLPSNCLPSNCCQIGWFLLSLDIWSYN